jgi:hypothetical protein
MGCEKDAVVATCTATGAAARTAVLVLQEQAPQLRAIWLLVVLLLLLVMLVLVLVLVLPHRLMLLPPHVRLRRFSGHGSRASPHRRSGTGREREQLLSPGGHYVTEVLLAPRLLLRHLMTALGLLQQQHCDNSSGRPAQSLRTGDRLVAGKGQMPVTVWDNFFHAHK